jgi:hypothetical protein
MKFDATTFSFLNEQEFMHGYSNVSQQDLQNQVMEAMALGMAPEELPEIAVIEAFDTIINGVAPAIIGEFDGDNVLAVKADANGMVEAVYGPAIFRSEEGNLVLKCGANLYSFTHKATEGVCGNLTGDVEVIEKEGKGEDGGVENYLSVSFDVYLAAPIDETIEIPLILDAESKVSKGKFKQDLKAGKIAQYLKPVPSGGNWVSMNDLELGEYAITKLEENAPHPEYGRSWTMTLEGVGAVRSKGKQFQQKLATRAPKLMRLLEIGHPVTLLVSAKNELSQGIQVKADFFTREPNPNRLAATAKPAALKSAAVDVPAFALKSAEVVEEQGHLVEAY